MSEVDNKYMARALELAQLGRGLVLQNPMVGAVVVSKGEVIGEGYHAYWGGNHAEVEALAGIDAKGSTLYVNLEPCCHFGKTPPCTDSLIKSGIARAVVATLDPNPLVAGKGIALLKDAGIEVSLGIMAHEARELNRGFFSLMTNHRPWVTVKLATTLDGKISALDGSSKWISNEAARTEVRTLRAQHDAVLVGSETFLADDPGLLTDSGLGQPRRFVIDPQARALRQAKDKHSDYCFIVAQETELAHELESRVMRLATISSVDQKKQFEPATLLRALARQGISSVLIEGGGITAAHFLKSGLYDRLVNYISPIIMGQNGGDGFAFVLGTNISHAHRLQTAKIRVLNDNVCVELEPKECLCLQD